MFVKISLLVVLVDIFIYAVSASPAVGTNAERMARGLPPYPPARFARGAAATRGEFPFTSAYCTDLI